MEAQIQKKLMVIEQDVITLNESMIVRELRKSNELKDKASVTIENEVSSNLIEDQKEEGRNIEEVSDVNIEQKIEEKVEELEQKDEGKVESTENSDETEQKIQTIEKIENLENEDGKNKRQTNKYDTCILQSVP